MWENYKNVENKMEPHKDLSFQEFRERFSTNEPIKRGYGPSEVKILADCRKEDQLDYIFVVPNEERTIPNIRAELKPAQAETYFGIVGGVLANFDYFTTIEGHPTILLTDVNERAIDHLAFMLYCTTGLDHDFSNNAQQFIDNIANLTIDDEKVEEMFGTDSEGEPVDFSLYQSKEKRKFISARVERYLRSFTREEGKKSWLGEVGKVTSALEEGRIKAYQGDIFNQGIAVVEQILNESGTQSLMFYLSNVLDVNQQENGMVENLMRNTSLDQVIGIYAERISRYNKI